MPVDLTITFATWPESPVCPFGISWEEGPRGVADLGRGGVQRSGQHLAAVRDAARRRLRRNPSPRRNRQRQRGSVPDRGQLRPPGGGQRDDEAVGRRRV